MNMRGKIGGRPSSLTVPLISPARAVFTGGTAETDRDVEAEAGDTAEAEDDFFVLIGKAAGDDDEGDEDEVDDEAVAELVTAAEEALSLLLLQPVTATMATIANPRRRIFIRVLQLKIFFQNLVPMGMP